MQNLNQRTVKQVRRLTRKRKASRRLVKNCVELLLWVAAKGGHIYYEWPKSCQGWQIQELQQLKQGLKDRGHKVLFFDIDGCAYGLKDSMGENFLRKRWQILTTDPDFKRCSRHCPQDHLHTLIQGKETSRSAFYPRPMCQAIANHWAATAP